MCATYNIRRGLAQLLERLLVSGPVILYGFDLFKSILQVVVDTPGGISSGLYQSFAALTHVLVDGIFLEEIFVFTVIVATGVLEGRYRCSMAICCIGRQDGVAQTQDDPLLSW